MLLCLGEPRRRFLLLLYLHFICCCYCSSFIDVLHSHLLFDIIPHPSWTIAGFLHAFNTFSPAHCRVIRDTSISTFLGSSYRERYGFEWAFFTHRRFLPYAPSPTLLNLRLSRPPWEPAVLP